jgi:gliding motility-associated-like protein
MKRLKRLLVIFLTVLLLPVFMQAQTCASNSRNPWEWPSHNNWYFGNGNLLNFSTGVMTTSTTEASYEGVSAASDDSGNLIFYTNGRNLWNAGGTLNSSALLTGNENGGTGLKGSASQGLITIRHPLNPNRYYVLTTDDALSGTAGLNYMVFDETGAVVSGPTRLGGFRTTEGISATLHGNGVDVWVTVAASGSTNYYTYLLECGGFNTTPVISGGGTNVAGSRERGGVSFSWDGSKFVQGHPDYWPNGAKEIQLYDFNNMTGALTNGMDISPAATAENPYDITFSPDNSRIYFSSGGNGNLWTMDISSGVQATIEASLTNTGVSMSSFASLEIGGDGNLYMSSSGQGFRRITGSLNTGTGLSRSASLASSNLGLPTIYIPPAEEPNITEVGPFCDTDPAVDLTTFWVCSGLNAEDPTGNPASIYTGTGITNGGTGIFDPATAGAGGHEIIFTKCAVDDTIFITVTACPNCTVDLKDVTPSLCPGETLLLDTMVNTNSGTGVWTVDSVPTSAGADGVVTQGVTDSIFDASNLGTKPGTYKLMFTVTDGAQTCKDSIYVTVNPLPVVTVNSETICSDAAAATFTATAATATGWLWSGTGGSTATTQTTSGTTAGDYTVVVTDAVGCTNTATGTLTVNIIPAVTVNSETICTGGTAATFTATSATATSWLWSGTGGSTATTQTASGTTAGDFTVVVTDAVGCTNTATGTLSLSALPTVTVNDAAICDGVSIATFTATSTVAAASYLWSANGTGVNSTSTGITAGNYTVEVTDINGCKNSGTGVLTVNTLPTVVIDDANACPGATQTITPVVSGGTGTYNYLWSTTEISPTINGGAGGIFSVTITDGNGCEASDNATITINNNLTVTIPGPVSICQGEDTLLTSNYKTVDNYTFIWSSGGITVSTSESYLASTDGTYDLAVDRVGCSGTGSVVLTVNALPTVTVADNVICVGEVAATFTAVSATATGWIWSGTGGSTATTVTTSGTNAGNYTVIVTDANNCTATATGILTVNAVPTVTVNSTAICAGDAAATFTATSATATGYLWSVNGSGTVSTTSGTTAGDYTVVVTDANLCTATETGVLTVNAVPTVTVANDAICTGDPAAVFTAVSPTATGYIWSINGAGILQTTSGTTAGAYTVVVSDVNGCEETATGTLTVNTLPSVTVNSETICVGDAAEVFTATSTTATGFVWSAEGAGILQTTSGTAPGNYTVVVTDVNGCVETATGILIVLNLPTVTVNSDTICEGDAAVTFTATSATATGYTWSAEGTGTLQTTSGTTAGDYTVVVVNAGACSATATGTLTVNLIPNVSIDGDSILYLCEGETTTIQVTDDANIISWDTGNSDTSFVTSTAGTYVVTGSNGGCPATDQVIVQVTQYPISTLDKSLETELICFETLDSAITFTANNTLRNTYLWNTGETNATIEAPAEGTYSVVISVDDGSGLETCDIMDSVTLKEFCPYSLFVPNTFTPNGNGMNDLFYAYGTNIVEFKMYVFDRWGIQIFEIDDIKKGWNGTYMNNDVQQDVYVWKIKYSVETEEGNIKELFEIGHVNVIR